MLERDPGERMPTAERAAAVAVHAEQPPAPFAAVDPEWVDAQLSRLDLLLRAPVEPEALGRLLLVELAPLVGAAGGAIYTMTTSHDGFADSGHDDQGHAGNGDVRQLVLRANHGVYRAAPASVTPGEGFVGQCAVEQRKLVLRDVPADQFRPRSALSSSIPKHCVLVPVWRTEVSLAVLELSFSVEPSASGGALLDRLVERCARVEGAPAARSSGLQAASSMRPSYRYGFWGKLSHELRSPLNSVLVLSQLLSENAEENLSPKQVEFARAIHASGSDLLALVNAISDLSKLETNRLVLEPIEMSFEHLEAHLQRAFEPVASERGLNFSIELGPGLPDAVVTDAKRLRQILTCLLSNAFKFTEGGGVSVRVALTRAGWSVDHERLNNSREVVSFAVTDTGVGMSESEQRCILEPFPAERIEARCGPGASGLGLAISRELARLLGGDLRVTSKVGAGSTFTLYIPVCGAPCAAAVHALDASEPGRRAETEPESAGTRLAADVRGPPASAATSLLGLDVMLVDDDVRSAFALTGILERQGAAVSHAEGVGEALQRLAEGRRTSALLIDADLLTSGSADSVRRMLQRCEQLPIIALTRSCAGEGTNDRGIGERQIVMPPHVHQLQKPVDPTELVSVLRTVADREKTLQSIMP